MPSICADSTLKSVSRKRSEVGRVAIPGGAIRVRERNCPAIIRILHQNTGLASSHYNDPMRGWTLPLGQWLGVELRVHAFFPLLALVSAGLSTTVGWGRGLALFAELVAAVVIREVARLLVNAWNGERLRAIVLLPIGGLYAWVNPEAGQPDARERSAWRLAAAGPLANFATALILGGLFMGVSPELNLYAQPLVDGAALVRSLVWMQVGLGLLHLVPAYPLDAGRLLRIHLRQQLNPGPAGRALAALGPVLAMLLLLGGIGLHSSWVMYAAFFVLIGAQIEDQGVFFQSVVDTVEMREVMLTDFATLSPSDTLADALNRCVHSLQEDFPVVRGPELVGIVNRQNIVDALRTDGNGYVQSVMSRAFQVARPEDTLGAMIRRISSGRGLSLIPVAESGRIVGIVSVQNLMSSMAILAEQRRLARMENE